ncbi:AraC family transcriptional regulator [Leifsonia sp. ZF2019]|uniref:helix-turn-helix transcriptional regulator n=1 Tax=Leifsonia sp. ZF2019 TaxID=2781978 RepID=UPI001CBD109A|nr:AraC family transcriptional regulator [Leifsonia sp. ZF2019]UAJ79883.1 AraC family transcriptional regulator [Leifsonia sp. ZF2019]
MSEGPSIQEPAPAGFGFRRRSAGDAVETWDVTLDGVGFARHRHETYGIGVTLSGVQRFFYRGEHHAGLAGEWHILHPGELHDGMPGDAAGIAYRIFYVDPAAIREAGGVRALPFVRDPIARPGMLPLPSPAAIARWSSPHDDLQEAEIVGALARMLVTASDGPSPTRSRHVDLPAVLRVAHALRDAPAGDWDAARLEALSGLSRWELARQFSAALGTSPSRYRSASRVRAARRLLAEGRSLADTATAAGFSDQAHLTRVFRETHGVTPGRWRSAQLAPRNPVIPERSRARA